MRKTKALAKNGVVQIEDGLYQVKSLTNPFKSYMVTSDSCDCEGFRNFYKFHHDKINKICNNNWLVITC